MLFSICLFLTLAPAVFGIRCYDTDMQPYSCDGYDDDDGYCVKVNDGGHIRRYCDYNGDCNLMDAQCITEHIDDYKKVTCCCSSDLCNSAQKLGVGFLAVLTLIYGLMMA